MEIVKHNETFVIKDVTDMFEMSGNISAEATGSFHLHFSVNNSKGIRVGDCHYDKYADNENVNFGVNCAEDVREELLAYSDSVIDSVLEHFKVNN